MIAVSVTKVVTARLNLKRLQVIKRLLFGSSTDVATLARCFSLGALRRRL